MKKFLTYILAVLIFILVIGVVSFAILNAGSDEVNINKKVASEVQFLDTKIVYIMNNLNNLEIEPQINIEKQETKLEESKDSSQNDSGGSNSSSQEQSSQSEASSSSSKEETSEYEEKNVPILLTDSNDVDWDTILKQAETLYNSWATITIDLNSINVSSENIFGFSENLDNLIISLKNKEKEQALINASNIYNYIPEYLNAAEGATENYYELKIKAGVLKAYANVETENWNEALIGINSANEQINNLVNSELMINNSNQSKIEETYILVNETAKAVSDKQKDMFKFKYIMLMRKIKS